MTLPTLLADALSNQLVGGGLVLMLSGAALALCRKIPTQLWAFARRQFTIELGVTSQESVLFEALTAWLGRHPGAERHRVLSGSVVHEASEPRVVYSPGPGHHLLWWRGRPILLTRVRREPTGDGGPRTMHETITLKTVGRDASPLRQLVDEAYAAKDRPNGEVSILVPSFGDWRRIGTVLPRALSTVVMPDGVAERIVLDLREFLDSRAWYGARGIPWRRGYLLHGPPGCGKSSLIGALAGHLGINLHVVNLAARGMNDDVLCQLLLDMPTGGAVLFEDIDAVVNGREVRGESVGVTFAGLLNALDGVATRPGLIVFMTTNHPERLDPALVRPGRIDVQVAFAHATRSQLTTLFGQFYGDLATDPLTTAFADALASRSVSMADVQQLLLAHRHAPARAVEAARADCP